jgi:hypothetical protein
VTRYRVRDQVERREEAAERACTLGEEQRQAVPWRAGRRRWAWTMEKET